MLHPVFLYVAGVYKKGHNAVQWQPRHFPLKALLTVFSLITCWYDLLVLCLLLCVEMERHWVCIRCVVHSRVVLRPFRHWWKVYLTGLSSCGLMGIFTEASSRSGAKQSCTCIKGSESFFFLFCFKVIIGVKQMPVKCVKGLESIRFWVSVWLHVCAFVLTLFSHITWIYCLVSPLAPGWAHLSSSIIFSPESEFVLS